MSGSRRAPNPAELRRVVESMSGWLSGEGDKPERRELATAVRLSLHTLATDAPGNSVEVRVPPFAAVQCVGGPRHSRGTPSNVVETDPRTWLRLAAGLTDWETAVADGSVSASGTRSDLSPLLPQLRLR